MRRHFTIAFSLAVIACEPKIPKTVPSSSVNSAVFDLTTAQIPQPNDISLQPSVLATQPNNAQTELLQVFAANGGFPNDQETPVTIQFQRLNVVNGQDSIVAPQLDISSLTPSTIVAIEVSPAGTPSVIPLAPITAADYGINGNTGTLTLYNKGQAPWPAGAQIIIAVRGGPGGITANGGEPVYPSVNFYLLLQNENLSLPQNTTLFPGDPAQQLQEGAELETLRVQYQPAFQAISALAFPSSDLAAMTTFTVAPAVSAFVETSVSSSVFPVPSDYLLNAAGTNVQDLPAFGPLAAGLATLDGFSTTALITATTSAPILAETVTGSTVFLYDLSTPATPTLVPDASPTNGGYVTQPSQVVQTVNGVGVSDLVALQPAVPISGPNGPVALPPLKEATEYAVVITNSVEDLNQKGLSRSTLSSIVLLQDPLVDSAGKSVLSGVSNAQAASLERMRQLLQPVVTTVQADRGVTRSQIAAAYTFRTQTITGKTAINNSSAPPGLLQLAALPYSNAQLSTIFVPSTPTVLTPVDAFARFGIDTSLVPYADIAEILESTIPTLNLLSDTTGAFDSGPPVQETIRLIVAVPNVTAVPLCPSGGSFPAGSHCAPLVVFGHGLGGAAGDMLLVANELVKQGFVVAATDTPKHGDRSWCSADNQCANGGTCAPIPGAAAQGDTVPPGICSAGLVKEPILCATTQCLAAWAATGANEDGVAAASSNYLISGNLFRTRDSFRQDVIDNSALILSMSRPPSLPAAATNPVTQLLASSGIVINPTEVYWEGQSLGSILGTLNIAANPRLTRSALNVGGGTVVDILTNAPAFATDVDALLASLGIQPNTPQYLQFILLAKWVLDPAEPVNVADNLLGDSSHPTLPNLLTMAASQAAKPALAQLAACDDTVPNAFNLELDGLIGLGPVSTTTSTLELFIDTTAAGGTCPLGVAAKSPGTVPHAFLTSWGVSLDAMGGVTVDANIGALTLVAQDQNAAFLVNPNQLPPAQQAQP